MTRRLHLVQTDGLLQVVISVDIPRAGVQPRLLDHCYLETGECRVIYYSMLPILVTKKLKLFFFKLSVEIFLNLFLQPKI